jgi:hypothetical protein
VSTFPLALAASLRLSCIVYSTSLADAHSVITTGQLRALGPSRMEVTWASPLPSGDPPWTFWGPSWDPLFFPQAPLPQTTIGAIQVSSLCPMHRRQPMALNHACEILYISTSPLPSQSRSSPWSTLASLLPLFSLLSSFVCCSFFCPASRYLTTPCWTLRLSLLLQQLPLSLLVLEPVSWLSVMESQLNLPAPPRSNPSSMPDVSPTLAALRACFTPPDSQLKT